MRKNCIAFNGKILGFYISHFNMRRLLKSNNEESNNENSDIMVNCQFDCTRERSLHDVDDFYKDSLHAWEYEYQVVPWSKHV